MIRLTIATIVGALAAAVLAWRMGGSLGGGVLIGFLLGAGMTGLGVLYQRHMLLYRPSGAMQALVVSFLAKLAVLLMGALAFRYIEAAGQRADWRSFLVAFAAAVAIILPLGTMDASRIARRRAEAAKQGLQG